MSMALSRVLAGRACGSRRRRPGVRGRLAVLVGPAVSSAAFFFGAGRARERVPVARGSAASFVSLGVAVLGAPDALRVPPRRLRDRLLRADGVDGFSPSGGA